MNISIQSNQAYNLTCYARRDANNNDLFEKIILQYHNSLGYVYEQYIDVIVDKKDLSVDPFDDDEPYMPSILLALSTVSTLATSALANGGHYINLALHSL